MKIARFGHQDAINYGVVDGENLVVLDGDPMYAGFTPTGERVPLAEATMLAPVIPRSKVVAIGKNYDEHAQEMGGEAPDEPLMFLKPNTAVIGHGDRIVRPTLSQQVDYEGELAVVIGSIAKHVRAEDAKDVIFGYTVANDVTARDLQKRDGQWSRAKGFDTFCPVGPLIETEFTPSSASIETRLNGETVQSSPLSNMVHSVGTIIEYVSAVFTLLPGDIILTGTPAGVGSLQAGDTVEVEVSGIGTLSNPVA